MDDTSQQRLRIATRIHDLLLHELGEDMDVTLLLGPPEYARAVLSLCRSCGSAELVRLGEQFLRVSEQEALAQRRVQRHLAGESWTLASEGAATPSVSAKAPGGSADAPSLRA